MWSGPTVATSRGWGGRSRSRSPSRRGPVMMSGHRARDFAGVWRGESMKAVVRGDSDFSIGSVVCIRSSVSSTRVCHRDLAARSPFSSISIPTSTHDCRGGWPRSSSWSGRGRLDMANGPTANEYGYLKAADVAGTYLTPNLQARMAQWETRERLVYGHLVAVGCWRSRTFRLGPVRDR